MKKFITTLVLCIVYITILNSVPAYSGLITIEQSDGTEISFYLKGDENFHFKVTEDGYLITENKRGIMEYARIDKKLRIKPMGLKARNTGERTKKELRRLKKADTIESVINKIRKRGSVYVTKPL